MDTRLILISGISGTGKSCTAQELDRQLRLNGVRTRWLHEECRRNPIRDGEFTIAPLDDPAGMERNIEDMLRRWRRLVGRVERSDRVYVLEGVLFENIIRYFFPGHTPDERILDYYRRIEPIVGRVESLLVHLYQPDVRTALQPVFPIRGDWWRDLIFSGDSMPRPGVDPNATDEERAYAVTGQYQTLALHASGAWSLPKLRIDTTERRWADAMRSIVARLGLRYHAPPLQKVPNPERYVGRYGTDEETIEIDADEEGLFCRAFWPIMRLTPLDRNRFEFQSFPIRIRFLEGEDGAIHAMRTSGNYDWGIVGATLTKCECAG